MAVQEGLIRRAYSSFNARDVDGALALMTDDVRWPKASEGGHAVGKQAIRAYWTRQWQDFDPKVEPTELSDRADGKVEVTVHQLVKSINGETLSDSEVCHVFTISNGLIEAMDFKEGEAGTGPSRAFGKPSR